jgi:hypothetical protein
MAAGDDLFFRRVGGELQNSDSVLWENGQELRERDLAMPQCQVVLIRPAAIVDVTAQDARAAQFQALSL